MPIRILSPVSSMEFPDTETGTYRRAFHCAGKHGICAFICAICCFPFLIGGMASAASNAVPFQPGEKFTYTARWGIIAAGEVTLEVLPMQTVNGVEAYHFAMITKTNGALDFFYPIRERQDSYVDSGMTHSLLYKKRTEGKYPRDIIVYFDWAKQETTRSNFGEKMAPIHIDPGTFDPLSFIFVIRLQDITKKPVFQIPITEGDRNLIIKGSVAQREQIEIGGTIYDTFQVVPDMEQLEADQIVKKSDEPELKIWFTADSKKIPVRIRSKVKLGHLDFDLR
jgi:hypothetical protein